MDKKPLVSIIVPVYGTEAYLPACIDSIRSQSYQNLQIILVDDHSPDRCPEICDSYALKDPRISVIHQENKGVSGARNTGLQRAAGEYIMFVDSDDELYLDAVSILLRDVKEYNADIVSGSQTIISERGEIISSYVNGGCKVVPRKQAILLSLAGNEVTISACAKLYRAKLIQNIRFEEGKNINEDSFFFFLCSMKEPLFVQHDVAVYQYKTRPGSNSRQVFSDKYLSMLYFCERKKELIADHCPQYTEQAHNMEVRTNLQMLEVLCRTVDRKYKPLEKQCVQTVRSLYRYHKPINNHHKLLAWIVAHGLYRFYKTIVRIKYYK